MVITGIPRVIGITMTSIVTLTFMKMVLYLESIFRNKCICHLNHIHQYFVAQYDVLERAWFFSRGLVDCIMMEYYVFNH